jgi:hypothetical protein
VRHSVRAAGARAELAGDATGRLLDADRLASTLSGRTRARVDDIGTLPALIDATGVRMPPGITEGLGGSMLATIDLGGTLASPAAKLDVGVRNLRGRLLPRAAHVEAGLSIDSYGVIARRLRATAGTSTLQASGRYLWRGPLEASVELDQPDLSEIASHFRLPVGVSGSGRLTGTLTGVVHAAQAQLSLSARDLAIEQVSIGSLTAAGTLNLTDGGLMTIQTMAPALGARADVEIVNRAGYPVSGEVTVEHQNIGELVPARFRQQIGDVSGRLRTTARGSGRLSDPAGIRGRIDVGALDATWRGTRLALASPATVVLGDDRIAADALDLRVGEHTRATLGGQLGVTEIPDALRLHIDGPLSELIDIGSRTANAAPCVIRCQPAR